MNVKPHNVRDGFQLEGTFCYLLRQQICKPDFNTVSGIGPKHQGFCLYLLAFHLADIGRKPSLCQQLLL